MKFEADEVCSFLRSKPDDSHEARANLGMSILSEQLRENKQKINRPTQEEEAAVYTTLDLSNVQENHVYDFIIR